MIINRGFKTAAIGRCYLFKSLLLTILFITSSLRLLLMGMEKAPIFI